MGAHERAIQRTALLDECARFLAAQPVAEAHRSLARHRVRDVVEQRLGIELGAPDAQQLQQVLNEFTGTLDKVVFNLD